MRYVGCEQGTPEWYEARLGKWTASFFGKAVTPEGKPSRSAETVNNKLVAEAIMGRPDETFQSEHMERGKELEGEAFEFLNFTTGHEFEPVGFYDSEQGYGASPDGMSGDVGLELKCPLPHTHLTYLAGEVLPTKYFQQVQGQMLVTGAEKWVFCSYHPELPPFVIEVKRDDKFCEVLKKELDKNCAKVKEKIEKIKGMM